MEYTISFLKRSIARAAVRAGSERMKERYDDLRWVSASTMEAFSHIIVAFFLVVLFASFLSVVEAALSPKTSVVEVPMFQMLGRAEEVILVPTAHAASGYNATIVRVEPSTPIALYSGEAREVQVVVKNTGTTTWTKEGANFLSLYTVDPTYHVSPYRGSAWRNDHQVGALVESAILPGEVGTFSFFVYGPPSFQGELSETFQLAAEDRAWVDGGRVTIKMRVLGEAMAQVEEVPTDGVVADAVNNVATDLAGYEGMVLIRSAKTVTAVANEVVSYTVGIKNTGTRAWSGYELTHGQTVLATETDDVSFYHPSWVSSKIAYAVTGKRVEPGSVEFMEFTFRAPHQGGRHTMRFQLVADGRTVPGVLLEVPVDVTSSAPKILDTPLTEEAEGLRFVNVIEEPRIRVGIDQVTDREVIFSATTDVRVVESDMGYERRRIPAGQPMKVRYNGKQYVFESLGDILIADSYLRFEGVEGPETIFTVSSFEDRRVWNTSLNDNRFRDTLEIRFNTTKDRTWLINELPMEFYLFGLDEATDGAPAEYHKALMTAARTYALYMWEHKTKYKGEFLDVRSDTYDQVYHGYGAEVRHPNQVRAARETRGTTIQYDGKTIVAAYFARSGGRTRNWSDVWGKAVPYAVSVAVPCEEGGTRYGHGVGMSQVGAACMADQGSTFDQILTHFYTGVQLVKRFE